MNFKLNSNLYEEYIDFDERFVWKSHENLGYASHYHAAMELCFVLKGKLSIQINDNIFDLQEGDISVCNPFEIHKYVKNDSAYVSVLIFSNKFLADFKAEYNDKIIQSHLNDKDCNSQIFDILKHIPYSYNNQQLPSMEKKAYVNLVLSKIVTRYGTTNPTNTHSTIMNILNYIYKNFNHEITLDTLSKEFNYTRTSISRLLSKALNCDLRCFVNNLRVEQVEILLSNENYNNLSILKIATMCGFDSAPTFYRAYKRHFNRLPRK